MRGVCTGCVDVSDLLWDECAGRSVRRRGAGVRLTVRGRRKQAPGYVLVTNVS
jgi:hypothetical protein